MADRSSFCMRLRRLRRRRPCASLVSAAGAMVGGTMVRRRVIEGTGARGQGMAR